MGLNTNTPVPQTSSGWVNDVDGVRSVTFKRNDSGTLWQQLSPSFAIDPSWQIVGIVVRYLGGTSKMATLLDGPPNVGQVARVYMGTLAQMVGNSPSTYDGNYSTYYGDATIQGSTNALTVIHDLGLTTPIGRYIATVAVNPTSSYSYDVSYSVDGVTWNRADVGSATGNAGNQTINVQFGTYISARFWRFSLQQTSGTLFLLRCVEFQLSSPGFTQAAQ